MKSETHESRTDPEARLMRKGKEAKLVFMGHALMENRSRLLMDFVVSSVTPRVRGRAEMSVTAARMEQLRAVT